MCPYLNKDSVIRLISLCEKPMNIDITTYYTQNYLIRAIDVINVIKTRYRVTGMKSLLEPLFSLVEE